MIKTINMSAYVKDGGVLRANPNAQAENNLKLAICQPCDETLPCLDFFEGAVAGSATLTSALVDGVTHTLTGTVANHAASGGLRDQLEAILGSGDPQEINVIVRTAHDGTTLSIEHQGRKTLTNIITSAGTKAFTRECDYSGHADYSASVEGAVPSLNGEALTTGTYAYTGTALTDAGTAGDLHDDIETALTALSLDFVDVTVTVNTITEMFDVVIHRPKDGTYLTFDTVPPTVMVESNQKLEWNSGALAV